MFTGIIEAIGTVSHFSDQGTNRTFRIFSALAPELKVDQSLSHDGVCLTVESVSADIYGVTAVAETLSISGISQWKPGTRINLERSLPMNGRLDGHLVQGHVDAQARCIHINNQAGSWLIRFEFPEIFNRLVIEKGSIAVNGISLTCFDVSDKAFSVAIIPYTYEHTNIRDLLPGSMVNIEFDLIGKYVERMVLGALPAAKTTRST